MSFTNVNEVAKSKNQEIFITHVATGKTVAFPGILTEYQDQYTVSWGNEQIFGRNDPIKPYEGTTRNIRLGFKILSVSFNHAKENLNNIQTMIKMLYPVYSAPLDGSGASLGRTLKAPPLLRVKFSNLIQSADGDGSLLGCIDGFTYSPESDPGYFIGLNGEVYPKEVSVSFGFTPQHESPLGWDSTNSEFLTNGYPYATVEDTNAESSRGDQNAALDSAKEDRALN
jgi:hypothetical protein|tara:strand:- start:6898 stop:7578 length:681 start_codon:yes stop_codon:yes gene_type:complete